MTVDDCEAVSRAVSPALDVDDPSTAPTTSRFPRPASTGRWCARRDFARWAGHEAKIEMAVPADGRKRFRGVIVGVEDGAALIDRTDAKADEPIALCAAAARHRRGPPRAHRRTDPRSRCAAARPRCAPRLDETDLAGLERRAAEGEPAATKPLRAAPLRRSAPALSPHAAAARAPSEPKSKSKSSLFTPRRAKKTPKKKEKE